MTYHTYVHSYVCTYIYLVSVDRERRPVGLSHVQGLGWIRSECSGEVGVARYLVPVVIYGRARHPRRHLLLVYVHHFFGVEVHNWQHIQLKYHRMTTGRNERKEERMNANLILFNPFSTT